MFAPPLPPCLNTSLRVMAVPTILFYKGGECVARISGDAVSIEAIKAEADKLV